MRDLAAQVTSSLLRFPEVTVDALGEDEIKLDSVLLGKFATGRNGLAWLACGPQLEVVSSTTGERLSAYHFSGVGENPPNVLAAREFSWLKRSGLLVGLEEAEGSMLCLYDLGISRVVKAVVVPGRITAIEPLISYGGASASTQHLHQSLRWFFGIAAVVTDVGHVLLIDLCLDDLSCSQSELEASDLQVINNSPTEIPRLRESVTSQGRHLCLQIHFPRGTSATALQFIPRTNQLAVGFSDGYLQLWNMKTLKKEYHSQLEGGRVPVYAFTFQEPENDPRNCCYLWAVQSSQDSEGDVVSLHLLQLAFGERKCLASGKILYEGLEYCEERYSQDLNGEAFALRTQATSTRLLGCQTIEKFRNHPDRDDSMNEVASPDTSVSIFSWQVKSYGQGKPSTYVGVFDINRWYHAQMPDSLRMGEFLHSCSYFALWSLDSVVAMTSPCPLLDVLVHERSLSRGLPPTCPPPEQFFNPTTYNFDATCLLNSGIVHLTCSGYQKETLSFLKKSGPSLSEVIPDGYNRCLMSGLLSSRLTDVQPSSLTQEEQLEAILSTAVETSTLGLITGCIRQWTSEEQPRSAANLRFILEWAWSKVVLTKEELDRICAPLFDSSCNFIDPQTLQLLQHCQLLLSNLSTILNCFLSEAQELTEKGLVGLVNKNVVSSLISQYARVVLWFCRSGLLPEGSDENVLQISRPFYNYPIIQNYYTSRREKLERLSRGKWCADCLLIDGLVSQCGDRIANLWKRDEGGTGQYPPPTLHALLDIFLLDTVEETSKHAIVIYLLLDVMYSFPNKSESSVESFPTAFAIPVGLVKLVQGFWLLDHNDHENSLDLLLHPATSRAMLSWQHARVIQALMCQGEHRRALRYIQMMKPATSSSSEIKLYLTVLLHNRCMVEAWALLRQHSNKLNVEELLRCMYEMCQSMGLMEELLKLPLALPEQECLEKFLQSSAGLQNQEFLMVHYLQQANYVPALQLNQALKMNLVNDRDPKIKERTNARNSILDQYGKVLPRVQRRLATERAKPYQLPSTILREVARPQPLSTVAKPAPAGNVLTRASFINNVLSKIGEVWLGKTVTPEPSPLKSLRVPELPSFTPRRQSVELPDAFVGTPITRTSKTISRILDLVVRPTTEKMPEAFSFQQTPPKQGRSWPASSPLQTSAVKASGLKNISKASELCLLQTPQVVKRARALTSTGPSFPGFTPQSILRTSQRPTPVGSPSASPGHSLTPPLRVKESRITFIEERTPKTSRWSNGIAADREINFLSTASPTLKSQPPGSWAVPAAVEDEEEEKEMVEEGGMAMEGSRPHETSQASARSADSTLEFHDAPTPEELEEEVVTLNPKLAALEHPSSAVVKASERVTPTEMQEEVLTEEEEEEQPMEQTGSDIVEQNTFSLDILSTLTRSGIRETSGAEFSLTSFTTSETVSQVTEEPLCPALAERPALETQTSEASEPDAVDSHSVVSVDDSEDSSSTESETKLEASAELDPDSEVEILEEVCGNPREQRPSPPHLFLEEQPIPELEYMEEHPAAVLPVLAHEAVEEEEDLEVEALEEEPVSFTELQPSAPLLIPVEFSEEPELDGDLLQLDHPNAFEPMVDHEDHAAPSNFTLMLEAEDGENGLADSVLEDEHLLIVELPPSAENRTGDQNGASERVEEEEVISQEEITPEGVVDKERPEPVPETLPYVPEPIKMAIAENLLDAIKDTRSKEFAAELLESSVQPEVLVTGRKTTSLTTTTMTSESVRETIHMGCGDALVEEMRRTRGASMLVAEVPISSDQPEAEEVKQQQEEAAVKDLPAPAPSQKIDEEETLLAQMDLPVPTTPKRAGRRRKNTLDSTFPVTPRRSTRNTRDAESDEALENPEAPINSKLQTPQKSTPHKGGRRAKNAVVVEPPEDVQERDGLNDQDIPMPVTPTRRRGRPSVPCVSESAPMVPDEMALDQSEKKVPSSPSRLTRKSVTLEIPHLAKTEEKDTEIAEQETLIPRKRGRKPKNLVAAEQAKTVQSEPPRTPGRTTRSRLALVVEVPEKELPPLPEILPQDEPGLPVAEDALKNRLEEETRGEGEEAMALLVEGEVSIRDNFQDDTGADQRLSEATDNTRGPSSPTAGPSDEPPTETEVTEAAAGTAKDAPKSRKPGRRARPSRLPPPAKESFIFSPPRTRSKKTRAKKSPDSPEAPPDSQPQFVFSPPTTRTRRKMGQEISRNITEDMEQQEVQDEVPKVSEETDTRAAKPRKKRAARAPKKAVWSPPPVEVNLISPMPSPEELPRGRRKKPEEAESPLQRMNLRRNRKRLMDTIFPKPVTRRKML